MGHKKGIKPWSKLNKAGKLKRLYNAGLSPKEAKATYTPLKKNLPKFIQKFV